MDKLVSNNSNGNASRRTMAGAHASIFAVLIAIIGLMPSAGAITADGQTYVTSGSITETTAIIGGYCTTVYAATAVISFANGALDEVAVFSASLEAQGSAAAGNLASYVVDSSCSEGTGFAFIAPGSVSCNLLGLGTVSFTIQNAPHSFVYTGAGNVCGTADVVVQVSGNPTTVTIPTVTPQPSTGCFGTVQLTLTNGAVATVLGVSDGPGPCDASHPPCQAFTGLPTVQSCTAFDVVVGNNHSCCTSFAAETAASSGVSVQACLVDATVTVLVDGTTAVSVPTQTVIPGPCP